MSAIENYDALLISKVGLYPRNGIYCNMDRASYRTVASGHRRRGSISWILAAKNVSLESIE
jgi:hypothetical protein